MDRQKKKLLYVLIIVALMMLYILFMAYIQGGLHLILQFFIPFFFISLICMVMFDGE